MTAHVWTKLALASALMVWSMSGQAQTSSGGGTAVGQGSVTQQTRPAPVSGKVANDPAAVALRPAAQVPATSKATQVAPPANPNEPLFSPTTEASTRATAAATFTTPAPGKTVEPLSQQRKPHVDRTKGVKKPAKTEPQAHDKKVSGKPRHVGKSAVPAAEGASKNPAPHKGKKKPDDKQAAAKGSAAQSKKHAATAHHQQAPSASTLKGQASAKHGSTSVGKRVVPTSAQTKSSAHRKGSAAKTARTSVETSPKTSAGADASKRAHAKAKAEHVAVKSVPASKASAPAGKKAGKAARAHKAA